MITWLHGEIVEKKQWCADLFSIKIKTAEPLPFKAGQFVIVGLDDEGTIIHRPYSLVNAPDDEFLEVHFNTVTEGLLSPKLASLDIGDTVHISNRPSGLLTLNEVPAVPHLWFCATGTGVGPFLSILNTAEPWQRFDKIILCYSVRTLEEMAYRADFEALVARYPNQFYFVPFVTREQVPNTVRSRISHYIENGGLEQQLGLSFAADQSHTLLCGNSNMLDDVTKLLEAKGLRRHTRREPGHIAIEKYY